MVNERKQGKKCGARRQSQPGGGRMKGKECIVTKQLATPTGKREREKAARAFVA